MLATITRCLMWAAFAFSPFLSALTLAASRSEVLFVPRPSEYLAAEKELAANDPESARLLGEIIAQPLSIWLTGRGDVSTQIKRIMTAADGSTVSLVLYNIPHRDCGEFSNGGAKDLAAYKAWVDQIASGIAQGHVIAIVEPDAIPLQSCLEPILLRERQEALHYAVHRLKENANTRVYLDIGNANWLSPQESAQRLEPVGIDRADGFAVNVANFKTTESSLTYGQSIRTLIGLDKTFVIDTGRNGRGPFGSEWCNPPGRGLGLVPTLETGVEGADAFLWIKTPGQSDGPCQGGPAPGVLWVSYALDLVRNRLNY